MLWETWKKAFYAWEDATAKYMEEWLKSPLVLAPSGMMLGGVMKAKAAYDKKTADFVGNLGLATKRDQERSLHTLNQLESRLIDLEEKLAQALEAKKNSN
ncbi:MAG: hypothetical protein U0270_29265 [Labilithrix sp.]